MRRRYERRGSHRTGLIVSVVAFATLPPSILRADSTEPMRLEYRAPKQCPDQKAFEALLSSRIAVRSSPPSAPARTVTIEIGPGTTKDRFRGHLTVREVDGRTSERRVPEDDCEEVVNALALVTALVLAPETEPPAAPNPPEPTARPTGERPDRTR